MEGDVFINSSQKNPNEAENFSNDSNFFVSPSTFSAAKAVQTNRHLNDYDYNILKEDAYKEISDEVFKLEYKISKTEKIIQDLDVEIQAARDIGDFALSETLLEKRKSVVKDLDELTKEYNQLSLSTKISGGFTSKNKQIFGLITSSIYDKLKFVLSKFPGKFASILEIKSSLDKLTNINKSVDELMSMKIPYGEANYRYEILSKYISKANAIQSEISKYIK